MIRIIRSYKISHFVVRRSDLGEGVVAESHQIGNGCDQLLAQGWVLIEEESLLIVHSNVLSVMQLIEDNVFRLRQTKGAGEEGQDEEEDCDSIKFYTDSEHILPVRCRTLHLRSHIIVW